MSLFVSIFRQHLKPSVKKIAKVVPEWKIYGSSYISDWNKKDKFAIFWKGEI